MSRQITWRDPINFSNDDITREENKMPSKTVPDQTLTVKQILDRYRRGIPANVKQRIPIYEGEESDFPELQHMDLAEREEYIQARHEELLEITDRLKKREEAKKIEAMKRQWQKDNIKEAVKKQEEHNQQQQNPQ